MPKTNKAQERARSARMPSPEAQKPRALTPNTASERHRRKECNADKIKIGIKRPRGLSHRFAILHPRGVGGVAYNDGSGRCFTRI